MANQGIRRYRYHGTTCACYALRGALHGTYTERTPGCGCKAYRSWSAELRSSLLSPCTSEPSSDSDFCKDSYITCTLDWPRIEGVLDSKAA